MRILHTADWHLGRIFHGINLINDQQYILEQFIRLVGECRPDVVLIAGDVFDRSLPPADAVGVLSEVLTRICLDEKVPVILISGNHDNPARIGFARHLLKNQNLHMVGPLTDFYHSIVIPDTYGEVYFCPLPYAEPAFTRDFLAEEDIHNHDQALQGLVSRAVAHVPAGVRKVALAHAFVTGCDESESERPLTALGGAGKVDFSRFNDFHYTALGHLHRPQTAGGEHIRYAGSLMKYSFSEALHRKSVYLVELDGRGDISYQEAIELTPRHDMRCIEGTLEEVLKNAGSDTAREDYIKVILHDRGALLDPIGKLRSVYPNVMDIERPELASITGSYGPGRDFHRLSELELFASFFAQVTGEELSRSEKDALARMLDDFYHREREGI